MPAISPETVGKDGHLMPRCPRKCRSLPFRLLTPRTLRNDTNVVMPAKAGISGHECMNLRLKIPAFARVMRKMVIWCRGMCITSAFPSVTVFRNDSCPAGDIARFAQEYGQVQREGQPVAAHRTITIGIFARNRTEVIAFPPLMQGQHALPAVNALTDA